MISPNQLYEHLHTAAFNEDVTFVELLHIALAFAVFWYFVFEIFKIVLGKWSHGKPWLKAGCERDFDRNEKQVRMGYSKDKSRDDIVDDMMKNWPVGPSVAVQHLVGTSLCIPSLIGYGDPAWASSLACLGILCEMGFEIVDYVLLLYRRWRYGKEKVTNAALIFGAVHHSLATLVGPYAILSYRDLRTVYWICFDMQFAGSLLLLMEYAKLLDITKQPDLMQFKVVNFIMFVFMVWTRVFHWFYLVFEMYVTWWNDEKWTAMVVGGVVIFVFSMMNVFIIAIPFGKRFFKFLYKSAEYETLPKETPSEDRRKSVVAISEAASSLLDVEQDPEHAMAEYLLGALEERPAREIERRQTMNPKSSATKSKSYKMMKYMSVPADAKFKGA